MKKFLVMMITLAAISMVGAMDWDILSIGFTDNVPTDQITTPVCGFKIGVPMCGGTASVYGIEAAVMWAGTEPVSGIKCSLIATGGKKVSGLQLALVNFAEKVNGLQLGIFNSAKDGAFQIGLLNHIESSPVPWLPLINVKF